jgi:hypothetical protein
MPERPASKKQMRFVFAAKNRGEKWAEKTAKEWKGKSFGNLPETARSGHKKAKRRK